MRLDRFLTELTGCSRTEGKNLIKAGKITVDGVIVKDFAFSVAENQSSISIDGKEYVYEKEVTFMLNKPAGVISATEDKWSKTVLDLLTPEDRAHKGLAPVGRLDKDTEGLLFLSNDGQLSHRLISPKKHADKLYFAKLQREITNEDIKLFAEGLKVDEELTALPAKLRELTKEEKVLFLPEGGVAAAVILQEGKFHQVKRMFLAVGNEVLFLKRMEMGGIPLDESLKPGEYRRLTEKELELLNSNNKSNK